VHGSNVEARGGWDRLPFETFPAGPVAGFWEEKERGGR